jgi:glycosyltransferase involved in cell wall biosynthesis
VGGQHRGDGPLTAEVERAAETSPAVDYLGRRDRTGVLALMRSSRALVFPSELYENFPVTLIEAFACGLPVIATRIGAIAEIVADGETGLLFTPGDPADLTAKVAWARDHPAAMSRMGAAARAEYEAKYTAERNYGLLVEIYAEAVDHLRADDAEMVDRADPDPAPTEGPPPRTS